MTIVHEAQTTLPKPASKSGSSSRPSRARNGNGVTTHTNGASPPTAGAKAMPAALSTETARPTPPAATAT